MTETQSQPLLTAPLSSLVLEHQCWANPRTILDDEKLAELGESIKDNGILVPLHVARVMANGSMIHLVLDGQRRVLAGSRVLAKNYEVPIVHAWPEVIDVLTWETSDKLLKIALDIGNRREALSSYELVETAERLKNRDKSNVEIARALNRSTTWVSRMLSARLAATPKLLSMWKRGEMSDEQFKALASEKDADKQGAAAEEVVAARAGGDKAEARMKAREVGAANKPSKPAKQDKAKPAAATATQKPAKAATVSGAQPPLPIDPPVPVKKKPLQAFVLEQMLELATKAPPVHDYVRGVFDALEYALGVKALAEFPKPWHQYIARLEGRPRPAKASAAKKAAREQKIAKAAKKRAKAK